MNFAQAVKAVNANKGATLPSWYGMKTYRVSRYENNKLYATDENGKECWFCTDAREVAGDLGLAGASQVKLTAFGETL